MKRRSARHWVATGATLVAVGSCMLSTDDVLRRASVRVQVTSISATAASLEVSLRQDGFSDARRVVSPGPSAEVYFLQAPAGLLRVRAVTFDAANASLQCREMSLPAGSSPRLARLDLAGAGPADCEAPFADGGADGGMIAADGGAPEADGGGDDGGAPDADAGMGSEDGGPTDGGEATDDGGAPPVDGGTPLDGGGDGGTTAGDGGTGLPDAGAFCSPAMCSEPQCDNRPCGPFGQTCTGGECKCPALTESSCSDGIDNNCDGAKDCEDPTCNGLPCGPAMFCGGGTCQ